MAHAAMSGGRHQLLREHLMGNVLDIPRAPVTTVTGLRPRVHRRPRVSRVVARRNKSLVFLDPKKIWAFEAADRLTFVHSREGRFAIDLSLAAIEASFGRALFRVHRNWRSEEHTSELQSRLHLVCRLLLEKKKMNAECLACSRPLV